MSFFDNFENSAKNGEVLRDFAKLFPAMGDLVNGFSTWAWWVNQDNGDLYIVQRAHSVSGCYRLTFRFEGDGVVSIDLRNKENDEVVVHEIYDDHYLDGGEKIRELYEHMNPRCPHKYSDKVKNAIAVYEYTSGN